MCRNTAVKHTLNTDDVNWKSSVTKKLLFSICIYQCLVPCWVFIRDRSSRPPLLAVTYAPPPGDLTPCCSGYDCLWMSLLILAASWDYTGSIDLLLMERGISYWLWPYRGILTSVEIQCLWLCLYCNLEYVYNV